MCGLAGAFSWRDSAPSPDAAHLIAARDYMWRRGQDDEGLWTSTDGRMILGYRRLAIVDPGPRSAQPMRRGNRQIIFNGEIYNFRELRRELEGLGERFETEGDAEVILALYARHGPQCIERLRGMFAFAIADDQARTLFLARDHYGMKPLYYAMADGTLYFASQVKALCTIPAISSEPDAAGLVGFHLMGSVPEPFTTYRAIHCLEAGHHLTVTSEGAGTPKRYANIAAVLASAGRDDSTPLEQLIRAALRDSVQAHRVADVEIGLLLSAGVDSGALLGLMRDFGADRMRTFTLAFPELGGSSADEVPVAREIARHYGAEHHIERVSAEDFDRSAEQIFHDMDQPTVDGINSWFASRFASRAGLKVLLSGVGADELLGGYYQFSKIPRVRRTASLIGGVPLAGRLARWSLRNFGPSVAPGNPKFAGALDYGSTLAGSYLLNRAILLPFELPDVLDPDMICDGMERLGPLDLIAATMEPDPGSDAGRMIALDSSNYMRNQLLRDGDWASMAHTLEVRMPFVDWPTLRAVAPVAHRLKGRVGKTALAAAASRPLPAAATSRTRTGFSVPIGSWLDGGPPIDRLASRRWAQEVSRRFGR